MKKYDGLALFSGGLDSILAMKVLEEQGLKVLGLHFVSPFFGHPELVPHWRDVHELEIEIVDVGREFAELIAVGPRYGFGKGLNPCVDCKAFMVGRAREMMERFGAGFVATGEVVGQRPMSQRPDAMNAVRRDAQARDVLLRPLCALCLEPTPVEESGLVDRSRLLGLRGRGRKDQIALAGKYGLKEIPTPAGGCLLTMASSASRFLPVLLHAGDDAGNFALANIGRQYWAGERWLAMGRNKEDNAALERVMRPTDLVFKTVDFPGPLTLGRQFPDVPWSDEEVADAAAFAASFCPRAVEHGGEVLVRVTGPESTRLLQVTPARETPLAWKTPAESDLKEWKAGRMGGTAVA